MVCWPQICSKIDSKIDQKSTQRGESRWSFASSNSVQSNSLTFWVSILILNHFGANLGPAWLQNVSNFEVLKSMKNLRFAWDILQKWPFLDLLFFIVFFIVFLKNVRFAWDIPQKWPFWTSPRKFTSCLKKQRFLHFYDGASSIFDFFIFGKFHFFCMRECRKMQFYEGASSIFEFRTFQKIVVFFIVRILVAGIYAKPLK